MKKRPDEFTRFNDCVRLDYWFKSWRCHKFKYGGYFKLLYYYNRFSPKKES